MVKQENKRTETRKSEGCYKEKKRFHHSRKSINNLGMLKKDNSLLLFKVSFLGQGLLINNYGLQQIS